MKTDKPLLTTMTLCFGMTAACAGPQKKATPTGDKPPIVAALHGLCRQVRAVAADASICPHERQRALQEDAEWQRIGASEQGKEIEKAVAGAPRKRRYAALVALAEQAGQPGWSCEELGLLANEEPSFVHAKPDSRLVSDLDEYCRIVEKNNREIPDPAHRAHVTSKEVERRAGCAMKELFEALAAVDPSTRYSVMQQVAAEAGRADWECAALDSSKAGPRAD
jgi:hypothetical protein